MPTPLIFSQVINYYLPEPQASLLAGIIFGLPLKTSRLFYQELKMVGLLHLVVLSGINITLLVALISSLTSFFSKVISLLLTILVIIIFIVFVGPQAPVIRAGFMGILTSVAILSGRRTYALYALFLSAFLTAVFWPDWIRTISFQLSYAATFGLIFFGQKIKSSTFLGKIKDELQTSLAAQIFTVPIIFAYFKEISLISPLANLLVALTIAPLMVFGFLAAFLGKINFYLGILPAYICHGLLSYVVLVVDVLAKLPFIYFKF